MHMNPKTICPRCREYPIARGKAICVDCADWRVINAATAAVRRVAVRKLKRCFTATTNELLVELATNAKTALCAGAA